MAARLRQPAGNRPVRRSSGLVQRLKGAIMEVKHFNLRRANEERLKAVAADNDEARRGHMQIAEIFERRAAQRETWREAPA